MDSIFNNCNNTWKKKGMFTRNIIRWNQILKIVSCNLCVTDMDKQKIISTHNLTKRFGDFTAVDSISFEVQKGEIFGFLGANGAGKTTAMRMLCGLALPTSGKATIAGFDIYRQTEQIKKNIGYMSQKFSLYEDLTIKENIRFYGGIYGKTDAFIKQKTAFLLKQLHLEAEANK